MEIAAVLLASLGAFILLALLRVAFLSWLSRRMPDAFRRGSPAWKAVDRIALLPVIVAAAFSVLLVPESARPWVGVVNIALALAVTLWVDAKRKMLV